MILFQIDQPETIVIDRNESGFDRASDAAFLRAISLFGIDDDGHTDRVTGWDRSECWVEIEFVRYTRGGCNHTYTFSAMVRKVADEPTF